MSPADSPFAQLPAPGPHPATAELRAYAAGTLTPADEHRIEAHTLDCARCADLVEGFSMTDAATTNQAITELRTRLQARVGTAEPEPTASPWAWPRIAAAAALLGVVAGGIWGWEQYTVPPAAPTVATATRPPSPPPAASAPPTSRPEPVATPPSPPVAAAPTTADAGSYAMVPPAPPRSHAAGGSPSRRPIVVPDREVVTMESAAAANEVELPSMATESKSAEAMGEPAASPASASIAQAEPPSQDAAGRAKKDAVADTAASSRAGLVAGRFAANTKAKSAANADHLAFVLGARVANTPMPAAPSIAPAPVGGSVALREYVRREATEFEPEINNLRLSGNVRVKFVVGADGKLSDLKVSRGLRADYDAEALRIVCDGPAWQPGIAGGKRAPLPMEITVPF
ncbi:energy transducer TonB [Hymenobacter terrenus]|uniref:energy transducer TonB n=1 Tax=Hymenobacter terrenus TaxID=1629124 RepID=UPI000698ABC2|nr:energy transducer TonB [Hymenobacter terrenus]